MTKARPQIVNMNGGEIDGEMLARVDLEGYANRAAVLENAFPRVLGGIEKAPGTRHIARLTTAEEVVFERFRFSVDQAFVVVLQSGKLSLIQDDAPLLVSSGTRTEGTWASVSPPPPPPLPPPPPPPPSGGSFPSDPGFPPDPFNPILTQ